MPLAASVATSPRAKAEIEITPEMIEAGVAILWSEMGNAGCLSPTVSETISEKILEAALSLRRTDGDRHESDGRERATLLRLLATPPNHKTDVKPGASPKKRGRPPKDLSYERKT